MNFQAGNYQLFHFDGAVNVPLGDKLAFRVAALREHRDGYFSNGGMESNLTGVRVKLLYEPTEALSVLLTGDYSNQDQLDNTTVGYAHTSGPPFFQWEIDPDDPWFVDPMHPADEKDDTFKTVSLKVDYDLGWSLATIIPAYRRTAVDLCARILSGPFQRSGKSSQQPEDLPASTLDEDQYTIEARLASPEESTLKWFVGGYYLTTKNQPTTGQSFSTEYESYGNNRPASSIAAFAQATYPVTDRFRVHRRPPLHQG